MSSRSIVTGASPRSGKSYFQSKIKELMEENQKLNKEVIACHDTLVTIEELCDGVLNCYFKNVDDKIDFCRMVNELDNKDLSFFKECFEAMRSNDLRKMSSLTMECLE